MTGKMNIVATKTYATEANADKAVEKAGFSDLRYFVMKTEEGRYFPIFVGQAAVSRGVHFAFHVVG